MKQRTLKDQKTNFFKIIYNSRDPSNHEIRLEQDFIKPRTLEMLTNATPEERNAACEVYYKINGIDDNKQEKSKDNTKKILEL